jgi:hypothetical protein
MNANRSNDDDLDALADRLRGLPAPPVPAGLEAKLLAAIPARLALRPRRAPWLLLTTAAAVLLAFVLGYFFGRPGAPPDGPLPAPAPEIAVKPPTLWNYRLAQDGPATSSPDPLPSSFEWPVPFTEPVNAHRLPDDLTD